MDAVHNLSDALSLVIAFAARRITRRPADDTMTFGYGRAEVVAALVNLTTLIVIGLMLVYEGVQRLFDPVPVEGWIVVILAGVAVVVDLITVLLTVRMANSSMNIRAAFLHNLADALGSVAVIVAGTLILLYDWRLVDPLVTLGIAAYILWHAGSELRPVIRLLILAAPAEPETEQVRAVLGRIAGVEGVHHVHLWEIDERCRSRRISSSPILPTVPRSAAPRRPPRKRRSTSPTRRSRSRRPGPAAPERQSGSSSAGTMGKNTPAERTPNQSPSTSPLSTSR